MELCVISTTTAAKAINPFLPSITRRVSSRLFQSDSVLQFGGRLKKPISSPLEMSCVSRNFGFLGGSISFRGGGDFRLFAAASPAVETSVKEDKLPADLKVTETVQANSSVRDFTSSCLFVVGEYVWHCVWSEF